MFGHFELVGYLAHPQGDLVLAAQWSVGAAGGFGDGLQLGFGGRQKLGAFAGAFLGQGGVVAAHQSLAGIVGVGDLEEVLLIEQRQLQRPGLDQGRDLRGTERADPV